MLSVLLLSKNSEDNQFIIEYFEKKGSSCDYAQSYNSALELIKTNHYKVLIINYNDSKNNGIEICKKMRCIGIDLPIIILHAAQNALDVIEAFNAEANDYLTIPYHIEELHIRALSLSNSRVLLNRQLIVGDLKLDLNKKIAFINNTPLRLPPTKLKVLETLMRSSPNPVSRKDLIYAVWGNEHPGKSSLRVHIFALRKILKESSNIQYIRTVPGLGFALDPIDSEEENATIFDQKKNYHSQETTHSAPFQTDNSSMGLNNFLIKSKAK